MVKKTKAILFSLMTLACLCTAAQKPVAARVMTFNIRLENKNDGINNWEMRYQNVAAFIKKTKPDIIGMQEVKYLQLIDLDKELADYSAFGVGRDDGDKGGEYNPIFYRHDKYNVIETGTFWLSNTPTVPSRGWDAVCNRIATWAIMQDKATLKSVMVLNTHFDHIGKQARANSAVFIKQQLGRMVNELPVIITGDFNVDETDPVYAKVTTGIFPLYDVWKRASHPKGPSYTYHGFGSIAPEDCRKIDFIFTSAQVKVKAACILDSALGEGRFLSDHNAHYADIIF